MKLSYLGDVRRQPDIREIKQPRQRGDSTLIKWKIQT